MDDWKYCPYCGKKIGTCKHNITAFGERYVQCGISAMRTPSGEPMKAEPIYMKCTDVDETGLTRVEQSVAIDFAGLCVKKHKEYIQGVAAAKREIKKAHEVTVTPYIDPDEAAELKKQEIDARLENLLKNFKGGAKC